MPSGAMVRLEAEFALKRIIPKDLVHLVLAFLPEPEPWDPWSVFGTTTPEYDSNGNYGMYPMMDGMLPGIAYPMCASF